MQLPLACACHVCPEPQPFRTREGADPGASPPTDIPAALLTAVYPGCLLAKHTVALGLSQLPLLLVGFSGLQQLILPASLRELSGEQPGTPPTPTHHPRKGARDPIVRAELPTSSVRLASPILPLTCTTPSQTRAVLGVPERQEEEE